MLNNIKQSAKNGAFLMAFLPVFVVGELAPSMLFQPAFSLFQNEKPAEENTISRLAITRDSALIATGAPASAGRQQKMRVALTAYSSHPDETDDTPFITASGTKTRDGVIAANFLPFGTIVRIPELFGDKVFVVEDRMHRKFSQRVDIWMPSKKEAILFGKVAAEIEILN
jgi:3D (Asp-Asp-Asp) domain-containing protein